MTNNSLYDLLKRVQNGKTTPEQAIQELKSFISEDLSYATIDHHRNLRRGLPEVIYGEDKTAEQIIGIADRIRLKNMPVLITRLQPEKWAAIKRQACWLTYSEEAKCAFFRTDHTVHPGNVVVCAAGTSDIPVMEEAAVTLETMGHPAVRLTDIGVAGLHRLLSHLPTLQKADVIIAVAGMEGALPSVIAGIVDCPVIGVPTSVGYGAALSGFTALFSMLISCAAGLTVVNIDNGFGAGYAAALMLRKQYSKQLD
ncbi:MAG: nickel pincer cofactor biosynthesis protein LarB [bacterium]